MTDPTATDPPSTRPTATPACRSASASRTCSAQMTLEEKAGLFFQTMITMGEDGELAEADPVVRHCRPPRSSSIDRA